MECDSIARVEGKSWSRVNGTRFDCPCGGKKLVQGKRNCDSIARAEGKSGVQGKWNAFRLPLRKEKVGLG